MPLDQAMELGQSFCRAEPLTVLMSIEAREREWSDQAFRRGEEYDEYMVPLLNSYRPAWALLRQRCGDDVSIVAREKQIDILARLLRDAIDVLQKVGANEEAARLLIALESR